MDKVDQIAGFVSVAPDPSRLDEDMGEPFTVIAPSNHDSPLIFNSPHSGNSYPKDLLSATKLDALALRRSEDSFVDRLFEAAPQYGAPLMKALFPRAYLDVNREAYELDPAMFSEPVPGHANIHSMRVVAGFGTIPRVVAEGLTIYRDKLPYAEAERRITTLYHPYHALLAQMMDQNMRKFGCSVLIDCHSMPSQGAPVTPGERKSIDFIIGDRYGASCAPLVTDCIEDILSAQGYRVTRNSTYAGGFITGCYGHPEAGQHAVQIEINRALYMDESRVTPTEGFSSLKANISALIAELRQRLTPETLLSLSEGEFS
jgi:N-formylglutamate amidohydrolase